MNWNISAWSIRNPIPPILLFLVLMAARRHELYEAADHPLSQYRRAVGLGHGERVRRRAGELETQVTKRIEDAVANITGVKHVTSTITEGNSQTLVEFRLEVDTDGGQRRQGRHRAHPHGSAGTIDEPIVKRIDVEGQSILTYAVAAPAMTLGGAVLVRGRYGDPQAPGPEERRARRPVWRRHARNPDRARPRPAERARHHRGRSQPRASRHQCRPHRRQRRVRRTRAGDPHAGRRPDDG